MSYFRNFNNVTRSQRGMRLLSSILAVCVIAFTMFTATCIPASAAGGIDFEGVMQLAGYISANSATKDMFKSDTCKYFENGKEGVDDWSEPQAASGTGENAKENQSKLTSSDIPPWDVLIAMSEAQNKIASDYPVVKRCCATASQIVNTFREQPSYKKAIGDLYTIGWTYDASQREFTVTAGGDQHKFDNALRDFQSSAASNAADNAFGDIYDSQNWDPNAGVAGDFLQSVYGVVNTLFFAVANLMLWFFLIQTGFDALYIIAEPVRPFIGPRNGSSGGGSLNNGGDKNILSKIRLPICSSAVEQACNGNGGGIGGNGAGGASAGNAFLGYAIKRFPVLICCAVYLILVTLGYWPKLISWVSGFAVTLIDFIMRIGK